MEEIWILILVSFIVTYSLDKAESVQLEELPLQTFDELFVDEWLDKDEAAEDLKMPAPTNVGQNIHYQIDRQNTQIGQIEPNSTDQKPPLTESDHSDNAKNGEEQNEIISNEKRKIVAEFHEIKDEFKQKGKFPWKARVQIEDRIAKHLKASRKKIYKWEKEFGLSEINPKNERKNLIEKFEQKKAELKRDGFKNSYHHEIDKTVAKELGLSLKTIYNWKSEFGQSTPNHKYAHSEQKELMKHYYDIKDETPKISDENIAKRLKIGRDTLFRWKKQSRQEIEERGKYLMNSQCLQNMYETILQ